MSAPIQEDEQVMRERQRAAGSQGEHAPVFEHGMVMQRAHGDVPVYRRQGLQTEPNRRIILMETASCDVGSPQYERGELDYQNSGLQSIFLAIDSPRPTTIVVQEQDPDRQRRAIEITEATVNHYQRAGLNIQPPGIHFVDSMRRVDPSLASAMAEAEVLPFMMTPDVLAALGGNQEMLQLRMLLNDKVAFAKLCQERGIAIPRFVEDVRTSVADIKARLGSQVMLKARSRSGGDGIYRLGVNHVPGQVEEMGKEGFQPDELYLQEVIGRDDESFGTIFWVPARGQGKPAILQTSRQLYGKIGDEKNWGGIEYAGSEWRREFDQMPAPYNERVMAMATMMQDMGYTGQGGVDMRDMANPRVIDTSPRWTGQTPVYRLRQAVEGTGTSVDVMYSTAGLKANCPIVDKEGQQWLDEYGFTPEKGKGVLMLKPVPGNEAVVCVNMDPGEIVPALHQRYTK